MANNQKVLRRKKIHRRIRSKVLGTADKPRMNVYKSSKHLYVQFIDDESGRTLAATSTLSKENGKDLKGKTGVEKAEVIGKSAAEKAKEAGIDQVVFDRGGYIYHGKVKAIADAARENGLKF